MTNGLPTECALVSTSGALLERREGREIDSARHVIRLGSAPLSPSLEPFVGGGERGAGGEWRERDEAAALQEAQQEHWRATTSGAATTDACSRLGVRCGRGHLVPAEHA